MVSVVSVVFLALWFSVPAWAEPPKPEVKGASVLGIAVGQTVKMVIYGENLAPKEVTVGKSPLKVKLLGVKATEGEAKKWGSQQVEVEVTVPANCPKEAYELTLVQADGGKATVKVAVVDAVAEELTVKKPNATFAQAMALPNASVAVNGTLDADTFALFRVQAKAGEILDISVLAGRVGSPLDGVLRLRDSRRNPLASSIGVPKRDRHLHTKVPSDGTYFIELSESEARGGPTFLYRLCVLRKAP